MKHILLLLLTLVYCITGFAQSADKGALKLSSGGGFSLMSTVSNENLGETGIALPTHTYFGAEYLPHDRIGIGAELYQRSFLTDDSTVNKIKGPSFGISLQYYFMNKRRSNAFIGTSFGGFHINYDGNWYPDSSAIDQTPKPLFFGARGIYHSIYLGYNVYFANFVGLYIKGGMTNLPLKMDYVNLDGEDLVYYHGIPIDDWRMLMRGGFLSVGITFKIGGTKEKEKTDE